MHRQREELSFEIWIAEWESDYLISHTAFSVYINIVRGVTIIIFLTVLFVLGANEFYWLVEIIIIQKQCGINGTLKGTLVVHSYYDCFHVWVGETTGFS